MNEDDKGYYGEGDKSNNNGDGGDGEDDRNSVGVTS